jgi:hypothetical protein
MAAVKFRFRLSITAPETTSFQKDESRLCYFSASWAIRGMRFDEFEILVFAA